MSEDPFRKNIDHSGQLKEKPICKPDSQLKKSRRIFNQHSVNLLYSFGLQAMRLNICHLREDTFIFVAGNYLNFVNIETMDQFFLPSENGCGFCCIKAHPFGSIFAVSEKGPDFCINLFSYPALERVKSLKHESAFMVTSSMEFHPQGELLVAVTGDPENKVFIWLWEFELMVYASDDSPLPIHCLHFSALINDSFMTSGKSHVTFWNVALTRDDRDIITKVEVSQQTEKIISEDAKIDIHCIVSISKAFISATSNGYLLFWSPKSFKFSDTVTIAIPEDQPCHNGYISHILVKKTLFLTLGSDGILKFWNYASIEEAIISKADQLSSLEERLDKDENFEQEFQAVVKNIDIDPLQSISISKAPLVYGIISVFDQDLITVFVQDDFGSLFRIIAPAELENIQVMTLISGMGKTWFDLSTCPVYPLLAAASSSGDIIVYNCIEKRKLNWESFSSSVTCLLWSTAKVKSLTYSFFLGFEDGSLNWLCLSSEKTGFHLKFNMKPHDSSVQMMKINSSGTVLVSQGSDSKLFFFSIEEFFLIPLGFYINHHEVIDLIWLQKHDIVSERHTESLLMLCKFLYLIEFDVPNHKTQYNEIRTSYCIQNDGFHTYKLSNFQKYHVLGDRIYDSDCEEEEGLDDAAKQILKKLKYAEKKEIRESRRQELGLNGSPTRSEIFSYLFSIKPRNIWLSLGGVDLGYIFEFQLKDKMLQETSDLVPVNALEVLVAETIPILSMKYSPCGRVIFMGLQDGSVNLCYLEDPHCPETAYNFAKYQIHDPDLGGITHLSVLPKGNYFTTAAGDGNIFLFHFNMFEYKNVGKDEELPFFTSEEVPSLSPIHLSLEDSLIKKLKENYQIQKEQKELELDALTQEYASLKEDHIEWIEECNSLLKISFVPEQLKMLSLNEIHHVFLDETYKIKSSIYSLHQKDFVKLVLLHNKIFNQFKSNEEYASSGFDHSSQDLLFRGCKVPFNVSSVKSVLQDMVRCKEDHQKSKADLKSPTVSSEKSKLERELSKALKAVVDYPCESHLSSFISKFNCRKKAKIETLQEHLSELEKFEGICVDDSEYNSTVQDIQTSLIRFQESVNLADKDSNHVCVFAKKKEYAALYFKLISKFWLDFNSFVCLRLKDVCSQTEKYSDFLKIKSSLSPLIRLTKHVCVKKLTFPEANIEFIQVDWISPVGKSVSTEMKDSAIAVIAEFLESDEENLLLNSIIHLILFINQAKLKVNSERKFHDMRFLLSCFVINAFKQDLINEKKWFMIIRELDEIFCSESVELSTLEEKFALLKIKRQDEKNEWLEVYDQFRKLIGLKQRHHKGYLKKVFKKKIRSEDEKEPYKRHSSSESSDSETQIESDDDHLSLDPKGVEKETLREVMEFRVMRHEVEQRMKRLKRTLLVDEGKRAALQRKIQRVRDALDDAWKELMVVSLNRKQDQKKMNWPVVLYPENTHCEFMMKQMNFETNQKRALIKEMSHVYELVDAELQVVNDLIQSCLEASMERVVKTEMKDLIDIAFIFYPILDEVSDIGDEEYKKLYLKNIGKSVEEEPVCKEEPVNYILKILSVIDADDVSMVYKDSKNVESENKAHSLGKFSKKDADNLFRKVERSKSSFLKSLEKYEFTPHAKEIRMSWRDVDDKQDPAKFSEFDVSSIVAQEATALDHLVDDEIKDPNNDYYMELLPIELNVCNQKIENLEYFDCALMLLHFDVSETVINLLNSLEYKELCSHKHENISSTFFPTHPGGGLVLTKKVLTAMENKDPDLFPYASFFKEEVETEQHFERVEVVHMKPAAETGQKQYDMTLDIQNFIILQIDLIEIALNTLHKLHRKIDVNGSLMRNLEKRVSKSRNKKIYSEQKLLSIMHEKSEEVVHKFSGPVNLDLLQDVIDNPHLRISKYESDKKLEFLKQQLKKLKDSEIMALKSLDKFSIEDTNVCHELLMLRNLFKSMNQSHASKVQIIPKVSEVPLSDEEI